MIVKAVSKILIIFTNSLKEILKPTYGIIIYQEQVMQIAQILAGFTAGEADILSELWAKKEQNSITKGEIY